MEDNPLLVPCCIIMFGCESHSEHTLSVQVISYNNKHKLLVLSIYKDDGDNMYVMCAWYDGDNMYVKYVHKMMEIML